MGPLQQSTCSLAAKLERFEGEFAVLSSEGLLEFRWPTKNLPMNIGVGETVILKVFSQREQSIADNDEKYAHMRKLLEELIN